MRNYGEDEEVSTDCQMSFARCVQKSMVGHDANAFPRQSLAQFLQKPIFHLSVMNVPSEQLIFIHATKTCARDVMNVKKDEDEHGEARGRSRENKSFNHVIFKRNFFFPAKHLQPTTTNPLHLYLHLLPLMLPFNTTSIPSYCVSRRPRLFFCQQISLLLLPLSRSTPYSPEAVVVPLTLRSDRSLTTKIDATTIMSKG